MEGHILHSFLDRFAEARVLCIGDVMLDRFVYGQVGRISPEAPIQVLRVGSESAMLGGAGNVARNVAGLGGRATLIAVIGDDDVGRQITAMADSEEGLDARFVAEAGRPSTVKTRYIAAGQQLLRADAETARGVEKETSKKLIAAFESALPDVDVVVLSDYAKGALGDATLRATIDAANAAGLPVIADPKRADLSAYAGVTVLKPNRAELATALGMPCDDDDDIAAAAQAAVGDLGLEALMVSRSRQGMTLAVRGAEPLHLPARALEVFDVSGAGDTVVATTAVALAAGAELAVAAQLANIAGGVVVGKVGTAVVTRDELASALMAAEVSSSEAKVVSADAAVAAVARWRAQGLRTGFTNGCFDLLHPGHVSLLTEARAACDRLIVGLNSDESVTRLKGEGRPIQNETARAIVLASLATVDLVVIFSEDTPVPLLELLKPEVLVKGGDYKLDEVVGAEIVRGFGGEVRLAAFVPGHSASGVIARMGNRSSS